MAEWEDFAACRDHPTPEIFYPRYALGFRITSEDMVPARRVCAKCPVRRQCLAHAFGSLHSVRYGIWAGTSPSDRAKVLYRTDRIDYLSRRFDRWIRDDVKRQADERHDAVLAAAGLGRRNK